jgi:hypothetical protein
MHRPRCRHRRNVYALILAVLAVLVALFYAL